MRRFLALIAALLLIWQPVTASVHAVEYYYRSYCESCDPAEDFAAQFKALTGVDLSDCEFSAYNAATAPGHGALLDAMAKYGLSDEALPMAVVDGKVYRSSNELKKKLPADALQWGNGTDSQAVYLYTPACESCARAEAALKALPDAVTVKRGDLSFSSKVRVTRFDVTKESAVAEALFDAYAVPEGRRLTPAVFLPGKALVGIGEIERYLASYVTLGWAVGKVSAVPSETAPPNAAELWGTLAAGLVAGFNGCALSMLLMFISLALGLTKRAWAAVAAFLLAKLAMCMAIGTLLISILQSLNPTWLAPAARGLMTALTAALAALTLRDAYYARKGELGRMKNQLPAGLRRKLQDAMRRLAGGRLLVPASIALGLLVAAGEFLCAGQLLLARLVGGINWAEGERLTHLLIYCLGFLAPSAAIAAAILAGRSVKRVSMLLARRIAAVKFLTAAAMLLLAALAWVV